MLELDFHEVSHSGWQTNTGSVLNSFQKQYQYNFRFHLDNIYFLWDEKEFKVFFNFNIVCPRPRGGNSFESQSDIASELKLDFKFFPIAAMSYS